MSNETKPNETKPEKPRIALETVYGIRKEPGTGRWRVFSIAVDPKKLKLHTSGQAEEQSLKLLQLELARARARMGRGIA